MSNIEQKEEQVSTKEFILSVIKYFSFLGKNWQILLIALLIGTSYDAFKNTFLDKDDVYSGQITFHLELEGGGAQNQLGGFASAFGLGGGMQQQAGSLLASTNFEAIVMSGNVFHNAFMEEVMVNGKKELFVNYYIDSSNIKTKEWAGNLFRGPSPYADYRFKKKKISEFTPFENSMLAEVYAKLYADSRVEPEEGTSLINIYATTTNEMLTKTWIETLIHATEEFYKNMKTKKTRQMLVMQEQRLDSLAYEMKHNDKRIARLTFDNPNVVDPSGPMRQQQLTRDNTYLSNQYYTQLANVESLNRLIIEQTPIFTVLEPVRLPLEIVKKTGISTRLSGLIALFAAIFIISIRKTYLDVMADYGN
ncbi:hypothetical protein EGI22_06920 [Lacihabitans sp. LS3-19]|uniref:hypothetical protein n=1 Tax=Lacihabitans sp. LS3-19 TaxID=2487335 RepID=UPI0020CFB3C2|nr:hypothetical protein [Lacihabitans sp. LS3-19]MCP9767639.1 hypothetical protein [Lacihabitans sp. LS3-19]